MFMIGNGETTDSRSLDELSVAELRELRLHVQAELNRRVANAFVKILEYRRLNPKATFKEAKDAVKATL